MTRARTTAAAAALGLAFALTAAPARAATAPDTPGCEARQAVASTCAVVHNVLSSGAQVVTGGVGGAINSVVGSAVAPVADIGLATMAATAVTGAQFALHETAKLVTATTTPRLGAPWFSRVYWRVAGIAVLLTVPFLFAAAVQAVIRSDLALLARAAFGYLPLAMLAVGVAAQLTALLLSATDGLSAVVSNTGGDSASRFLASAAASIAGGLVDGSPFMALLLAVFTVAGAIVLWLEMVIRNAAVYVIVVMLPLAFAAMVWPARRVWALRAVELLVALILSKLAIVTVLTLGGAALNSVTVAGFMAGLVLLVLAVFAPWAMLRLVPMAELASGAVSGLMAGTIPAKAAGMVAQGLADSTLGWASATTAQMRRDAGQTAESTAEPGAPTTSDTDAGGAGSVPAGDGPRSDGGSQPPVAGSEASATDASKDDGDTAAAVPTDAEPTVDAGAADHPVDGDFSGALGDGSTAASDVNATGDSAGQTPRPPIDGAGLPDPEAPDGIRAADQPAREAWLDVDALPERNNPTLPPLVLGPGDAKSRQSYSVEPPADDEHSAPAEAAEDERP